MIKSLMPSVLILEWLTERFTNGSPGSQGFRTASHVEWPPSGCRFALSLCVVALAVHLVKSDLNPTVPPCATPVEDLVELARLLGVANRHLTRSGRKASATNLRHAAPENEINIKKGNIFFKELELLRRHFRLHLVVSSISAI